MALPQVTKGQQEKAVRAVGTETLLSPRCAAAFCFPSGSTSSERKLPTMKKTYVLDTNVLIQAPYALKCFEDNRIVLPLAVLEELDATPARPSATWKASAFGATCWKGWPSPTAAACDWK